MDDPLYVLKGALVGGFVGSAAVVLYDVLLPGAEQRVAKLKRKHRLQVVAMDVDPDMIRCFVALKQFEPVNPRAWAAALHRFDSVCMLYKRLAENLQQRASLWDYSVAHTHYTQGMNALRSLYESVRDREWERYEEREAARRRLEQNAAQRSLDRRNGLVTARSAQERQQEHEDSELVKRTQLACDTLERLMTLLDQQTESKLYYVHDRAKESVPVGGAEDDGEECANSAGEEHEPDAEAEEDDEDEEDDEGAASAYENEDDGQGTEVEYEDQ